MLERPLVDLKVEKARDLLSVQDARLLRLMASGSSGVSRMEIESHLTAKLRWIALCLTMSKDRLPLPYALSRNRAAALTVSKAPSAEPLPEDQQLVKLVPDNDHKTPYFVVLSHEWPAYESRPSWRVLKILSGQGRVAWPSLTNSSADGPHGGPKPEGGAIADGPDSSLSGPGAQTEREDADGEAEQ